jgi:hypothetical protein
MKKSCLKPQAQKTMITMTTTTTNHKQQTDEPFTLSLLRAGQKSVNRAKATH